MTCKAIRWILLLFTLKMTHTNGHLAGMWATGLPPNSDQRAQQGSFVSETRSYTYWLLKGHLLILLGRSISLGRTTCLAGSSRVLAWEVTVMFKSGV